MEPFAYMPLEGNEPIIRLFQLSPARDIGTQIEGHITQVSLGNPPLYMTVSYTWGAMTDERNVIMLNGRQFFVTKSLDSLLKHIRDKEKTTPLWVDQICIDQGSAVESLRERSQQVKLMWRIYHMAGANLIWLGEQNQNSDRAMSLLEGFDIEKQDMVSQPLAHSVTGEEALPAWPLTREDLVALQSFLDTRPLWTRIWIVQEVAFAKRILIRCGFRHISWSVLGPTLHYWDEQFRTDDSSGVGLLLFHKAIYSINSIEKARLQAQGLIGIGKDWGLSYLLRVFAGWKASDPRDNVFALLGLCSDKLGVIPDYTMSVCDVFTTVTAAIIKKERRLSIICHVTGHMQQDLQNSTERQFTLPSWVPDYTTHRIYLHSPDDNEILFNASGTPFVTISTEHGTLTASGHCLGSIKILYECPSVEPGTPAWEVEVWKSLPIGVKCIAEALLGRGALFSDTVLRTMILDLDDRKKRLGVCNIPSRQRELANWYLEIASGKAPPPWTDSTRDFFFWITKMRFGLAQNGDLVRVPINTEIGDIICILDGAPVPTVLRRSTSRISHNITQSGPANKFTLVGPAYWHGFMDGEVLQRPEFPRQEFSLV